MSLNLGTILMATARIHPSRRALQLGERAFTYEEIDRAARSLATALHERGIGPGSNVAVLIPNLPEFTISYFGILYAGCTVVPLNVLLTGPEVAYHLDDAQARLLIAHPLFSEAATAGAAAAGVPVVWAGDAPGAEGTPLSALLESPAADHLHPTSPDETAVILYTSGTTGKPKGAELTHSNLFLNAAVVTPNLIAVGPDDIALATLPLFHSFGQTCIQNTTLSQGASFTLLPRFTPEEALSIIQRDRVTIFAGVPTMYFAILHYPDADRYDLSSLRCCMTGGAAMPVEVMKAFEERYGVPVLEGYGLSETSPVASFNLPDRARTAGTIGWPVWGVEMAILDEHDRALPDGETGEIGIRGHNIMKGYWRRPDATAECMGSGWFHSGDIGLREANGCYRIVDRKKDMIIRGGFNVYPREIEEVLYAHPDIIEAAVIGIVHESHGEEVKAVVVSRPGTTLADTAIIEYCKARLAAYKYPRIVEFRETLPKGPTGKILKRELR
jgi:long-chain acyl-CoA synthetase